MSAFALAASPEPETGGDLRANLLGMTRPGLTEALARLDVAPPQRPMRVRQLMHWVHYRGSDDFSAMTDIAAPLRSALAEHYDLTLPQLAEESVSRDGTRKWLLRLGDGSLIESVYIPERTRATICVSSQVGCTLSCRFCHTGTQRLVRNLTAAEIVGQVFFARRQLAGDPIATARPRVISNIVMMGMGEPLYNFDAVKDALSVLSDSGGMDFSKRRITLSTAGVVPMMARCGSEIGVRLAVSLHAADDDLRNQLVPLNKKYPLATLMQACRDYPSLANSRRITFEYVMLEDVNDNVADAQALVALIAGIPAKINLIPFNQWPGSDYRRSSPRRIEAFAAIIRRAGYTSPVRMPRGEDIDAACGQLRTATERPRRVSAAMSQAGQRVSAAVQPE